MELEPTFLLQYYYSQVSEFERHLRATQARLKEESIHDLRVSLKRIRAFLRLLEYISPSFSQKEHFKPLRKVFKEVALLRDIQVQNGLMKEWQGPQDRTFKVYLQSREVDTMIELSEKISSIGLDPLLTISPAVETAVKDIPRTGLVQKIMNFILLKIETGLAHYSDHMHQTRILLKDAYYTLQILEQQKALSADESRLLDVVDELQEIFGLWHDWEIMLDHFDRFLAFRAETNSARTSP